MDDTQEIGALATLSLAGSGWTRAPRVKPAYQPEDYLSRFDADTLWLDAIWQPGRVTLVCPRLNNLTQVVRGARFALDGRPVRARMRHFHRHSVILLPAPTQPARVSVEIGDWRGESPVHDGLGARLAGRNVLITLSKDNDPRWIEDWARFHVHHQGAEAAIVVDNGSRQVDPGLIAPALRRAGLRDALVLRTAVPFVPRGKKPYANTELFLQTSVLNVLRLRFLRQARAVLSCDIDELVMAQGTTVFDRVVRHPLGYLRFDGHWVHPPPGTQGWCDHTRHTHRDDPPRPSPPKWCIRPQGPLRGWHWSTHGVERLPLLSQLHARDVWFYHCRGVNTGWKLAKRERARENTVPDARIGAAMEAAGLVARAGTG